MKGLDRGWRNALNQTLLVYRLLKTLFRGALSYSVSAEKSWIASGKVVEVLRQRRLTLYL